MQLTLPNYRLGQNFNTCFVNAVFNFTVMEQYTGKRKTITVPVSMQFIPMAGNCVP